jgi:hypothetical protein
MTAEMEHVLRMVLGIARMMGLWEMFTRPRPPAMRLPLARSRSK